MIIFNKKTDAMITCINRVSLGLSTSQRERLEVLSPSFLTFKDGFARVYQDEVHYSYKDDMIVSELKEKLDQ